MPQKPLILGTPRSTNRHQRRLGSPGRLQVVGILARTTRVLHLYYGINRLGSPGRLQVVGVLARTTRVISTMESAAWGRQAVSRSSGSWRVLLAYYICTMESAAWGRQAVSRSR